MRRQGMSPASRIQLDADPEWSESFLGPEPEFRPTDARVWELYWTARRAQPGDAFGGAMPLDLARALDLNERLFEIAEPRMLAAKLQAMDSAYLEDVAERRKRAKDSDEAKSRGRR